MTKYVMVTALSTYRMRYVAAVEDLQKLNPEMDIEGHEIEWMEDIVTCEEVDEFSQHWLGETILDAEIITQEQMLERFDKENDYLKGWADDYKVNWVRRNLRPVAAEADLTREDF